MEKLKGVIIGCGAIAREHLSALAKLQNVETVAVCDISPARAQATAERFGVPKFYLDFQEMLAEIRPDLVHITTPPSSHFSIARSCLAGGLNVVCEKPITVNYKDFANLRRLAEEKGCMLIENQNLRFHSSIQKIESLLKEGKVGDVLDVHVLYSLNILDPKGPYADPNAPHYALALDGGVIGDFLTHIAYLVFLFCGSVTDVRTIWMKRGNSSVVLTDEFRSIVRGRRATGYVTFSGNAHPNGLWIRISGTRMYIEANLLEPPRMIVRRLRTGQLAIASLIDGISEARDVLSTTITAFLRKSSGASSYDGLPELIARTYRAIQVKEPQPIALDEIDEVARLVERFTRSELRI